MSARFALLPALNPASPSALAAGRERSTGALAAGRERSRGAVSGAAALRAAATGGAAAPQRGASPPRPPPPRSHTVPPGGAARHATRRGARKAAGVGKPFGPPPGPAHASRLLIEAREQLAGAEPPRQQPLSPASALGATITSTITSTVSVGRRLGATVGSGWGAAAPQRAWGAGTLGSVHDAPLAGAPGTSHKPPLLQTLEDRIAQQLAALNHKYRGEPFVLPMMPPQDAGLFSEHPEVAAAAVAPSPRQRPECVGVTAMGHLVNDPGPGDTPAPPARVHTAASQDTNPSAGTVPAAPGHDGGAAPESAQDLYRRSRHGVFRHACNHFAVAFKTYRPLLSWIMAEYEGYQGFLASAVSSLRRSLAQALKDRDDAIDEATHLSQKFSADRRVFEREAAQQRRRADRLRAEVDRWHLTQQTHLDDLRTLQAQVEEAEEAKQHLHKQVSRLERSLHEEKTQDNERKLRVHLEAELEKATQAQNEVQRLHEVVLRENRFLKDTAEDLQQQLRAAGGRGKQGAKTKRGRRVVDDDSQLTPRPDWEQPHVAAAVPYLGNSTAGSVEAVALRVSELEKQLAQASVAVAAGDGEGAFNHLDRRYLLGLGAGDDVNPPFLRHTGRFKNMRMMKPTVEQLVKEFWFMKGRTKESATAKCADYLPIFLRNKYGHDAVAEYTYNIWFALQRFRGDPDCGLFVRLLKGDVEEALWHEQGRMLQRIHDALIAVDTTQDKLLGVSEILEAVQGLHPAKEDDSLAALEAALYQVRGARDEGIKYAALFEEDADCNQTPFVELLRAQHTKEGDDYIRELEEAVVDCDDFKDGVITPSEMSRAVWSVDPGFPADRMDSFLASAFQCPVDDLQPQTDPLAPVKSPGCTGLRTYAATEVTKPLPKLLLRIRDIVLAGAARRHTPHNVVAKMRAERANAERAAYSPAAGKADAARKASEAAALPAAEDPADGAAGE